MNNIMRVDFKVACVNSDGEIVRGTERDICILYNQTVITCDEVSKLINSDEYKYDNRIVVTTPTQADNLKGKKEN